MNRSANIHAMHTEDFDLCIIGGGASGAGCALDAALRGLRVALVEKDDFAAETSSKSTKLIHGGVRYLEQAFKNLDFAQLRQVRHGLHERHTLLANAPHLARPLALITPVFGWWEGLYFSIGLRLYDWFAAARDTLPKSRWLSRADALRRLPGLSPKLHSAVLYHDGQLDDARYCLALAQSADKAGAKVANHLELVGFEQDSNGKLCAAQLRCQISGTPLTLRAKLFLNCTGPKADLVRHMANPALAPRIRPSKGVHVMLPAAVLGSHTDAMLIPKTRDGRVVFAIPFEEGLMLGTTDDPWQGGSEEPSASAAEADFLLETLERYTSKPVGRGQIRAAFGGLRPLVAPERGNTGQTKTLLRDHVVEMDGQSGLLSLLGGKWTTYRLMAKDAVDAACAQLGRESDCRTAGHLLVGAEGWSPRLADKISASYGLEADIAEGLSRRYGAGAADVAALALEQPAWAERLLPGWPYLKAEVIHAVRSEMACTLRDFLARRIRLEIGDWQAAAQAAAVVAQLMATEMGMSQAWAATETDAYRHLLQQFQAEAGLKERVNTKS
jgi:glycerol-3-phosphate dehydrogenase